MRGYCLQFLVMGRGGSTCSPNADSVSDQSMNNFPMPFLNSNCPLIFIIFRPKGLKSNYKVHPLTLRVLCQPKLAVILALLRLGRARVLPLLEGIFLSPIVLTLHEKMPLRTSNVWSKTVKGRL